MDPREFNLLKARKKRLFDEFTPPCAREAIERVPNKTEVIHVEPEVFGTKEMLHFAVHPEEPMQLFTRDWLECSILEWFAMSLNNLTDNQSGCIVLAPSKITKVICINQEADVKDYLRNVVAVKGLWMYLAPYHAGNHWSLFAICPEDNFTFILDSKRDVPSVDYNPRKPGLTKIVKELWPSMKIKQPKCTKQDGGWECGYCVMSWMYEVMKGDSPWTGLEHLKEKDLPNFSKKQAGDIIEKCILLCGM